MERRDAFHARRSFIDRLYALLVRYYDKLLFDKCEC